MPLLLFKSVEILTKQLTCTEVMSERAVVHDVYTDDDKKADLGGDLSRYI